MNDLDIYSSLALLCVIFLGIPHGGMDAAIARKKGWPQSYWHFITFHASYLCLSGLVIYLWYLFPLVSLFSFLVISGFHFGMSDLCKQKRKKIIPLFAHGGLIPIVIPYMNQNEVLQIFIVLVGEYNAVILIDFLAYLVIPWLISFVLYSYYVIIKKDEFRIYINLPILLVIIFFFSPLISFASYFCLVHSPRHIKTVYNLLDAKEKRRTLYEALSYSLIAFAMMLVSIFLLDNYTFSDRSLLIVFVGLASLTVPHMILVDYIKENKIN